MTLEQIFYLYGAVYIIEILYHIFKVKKLDDSAEMHFDTNDLEGAIEHTKKNFSVGTFVLFILGFAWLIVGLFTPYTVLFASMLILNVIVPMFMVKKPVEELVKLHYVWNITQIALVSIILYLYFSPILN